MFHCRSSRVFYRFLTSSRAAFSSVASRGLQNSGRRHLAVLGAAGLASGLAYSISLDSAPAKPSPNSSRPLPDEIITSFPSSYLVEPRAALPDLREAAKISLEELAKLYQAQGESSATLAIPLVFTRNDPVAIHREMEATVRRAQERICQDLTDLERAAAAAKGVQPVLMREDLAIRADGGGGGFTRIIQEGLIFSKAACNSSVNQVKFSLKQLKANKKIAEENKELREFLEENNRTGKFGDDAPCERFTASISLVLHSNSSAVPTVHANYRFFDIILPSGQHVSWFGGGSDLTPTTVDVEDAKFFHSRLKGDCDALDRSYYPKFKKRCDEYFYLPHREETRGVGGIFFDYLSEPAKIPDYLNLVKRLSSNFSASYFPLVLKHSQEPQTAADWEWKKYRNGRYVEFNLLEDEGTKFGLMQPYRRVESIFVSLPLEVRFEYKREIPKGSKEEFTMNVLKNPVEWISEENKQN